MNRHHGGRTLSEFIDAGKRPRNQIATLSGLTNTYIRNLENGDIKNVPRERLIALGVALNLDLSEIETLLAAFDRAGLCPGDATAFIETAQNAALSEAVLPVRDLFAYELILLSLEMVPGRQVIVSDRPTISLLAPGHRSHTDREVLHRHPMYKDLIEVVGRARRDNFHKLAASHSVEHYICRQCLEDYLNADVDAAERAWRARHVRALLDAVKQLPNVRLYLTDTCVNLNFTIKFTGHGEVHDKLSYSARAPHDLKRGKRGRLIGFITENPALCQCFKDELARVTGTVLAPLTDYNALIDYLETLLPMETKRDAT
jgi:transcriptional regulator with XRE-family HTH domain